VYGCCGRVEDLFDGSLFDLAAAPHDDHVVGHLRHHAHVVGDEHHRRVQLPLQLADDVEDLGLDGDVERRGRFVGDQQRRLAGQRHGDHGALAHAAGQGVRIGVEQALRIGQPHQLQQRQGLGTGLRAVHALVQHQRLGDLVADGEHRVQRRHRLLEDHRDLVAADGADRLVAGMPQVLRPAHRRVEQHLPVDDAAARGDRSAA
jgi:hypothetical protein